MFAIAVKIISLASFNVRLAMPEYQSFFLTSFSVISNFVCEIQGPDNPKKMQGFFKILHGLRMRNLYISLSIPPKLLFVFSTKIYSQF